MNEVLTANVVNLKIRVRYAECDAQQVVFNARYADYADLAATEYIRTLIGNHAKLLDAGYDIQVVNLTIDWFASATFDDTLNLAVRVVHVGNTSFQLITTCTKLNACDEHEPIAQIKTTYVVVDTVAYQKAKIPLLLTNNFMREFTVLIDQAG